MRTLKLLTLLVSFCAVNAFLSENGIKKNTPKMLVGVSYAMSEAGVSNEMNAGISAWGTIVSTVGTSAIAGPAGLAAGLLCGL